MVITSTYHYFYPVSHFETANGIHYLLIILLQHLCWFLSRVMLSLLTYQYGPERLQERS